MNFNILNIGVHVLAGNSIINCEVHSHPPYANTILNNSDKIRIYIQTESIFTLPCNGSLYFQRRLVDQEGKLSAAL